MCYPKPTRDSLHACSLWKDGLLIRAGLVARLPVKLFLRRFPFSTAQYEDTGSAHLFPGRPVLPIPPAQHSAHACHLEGAH